METAADSLDRSVAVKQKSLARAETLKTRLIEAGMHVTRLESSSFGSDQPLVSKGTPEGWATNRRIEPSFERA
jgi:outer membrane protein OmpA-like peptidoglycan-associated protein